MRRMGHRISESHLEGVGVRRVREQVFPLLLQSSWGQGSGMIFPLPTQQTSAIVQESFRAVGVQYHSQRHR